MKNISNFILEKFNLKSISKGNTPDKIKHDNRTLLYFNKYARAFIYNVEKDKILFSEPGGTHMDIIDDTSYYILKDLGLDYIDDLNQLRFCNSSDMSKKKWKEENKETEKTFKLGRIWIIPPKEMENDDRLVYVAWWNELSSSEFNKYNKRVLDFFSELNEEKYEECIFIDNNGVTKYFNINKNVRVKKSSQERKNELQLAKNIHLASQREKKKFFAKFVQNRDEENQKKYYNHTRSKTEAEYRSIKYQESLNI